MPEKDLSALFLDTLKDIYYAEKQIYKALPKLAKVAQSAAGAGLRSPSVSVRIRPLALEAS